MTEQEAKEMLEERFKFALEHYKEECLEYAQALKKGVVALEKQIPKKVIITRESCGIQFGKCPLCNEEIDQLCNPFYHTDASCLQKLKWN